MKVDYEEEEVPEAEAAKGGDQVKKGYVGIHSSGFKDFLLKPELLRAIQDCGFEHPSEGKWSVLVALLGTRRRSSFSMEPGLVLSDSFAAYYASVIKF